MPLNTYLMIGVAIVGAFGGYQIGAVLEGRHTASCADAITSQIAGKCPKAIDNAMNTVSLKLANDQLGKAQKTIPIPLQGLAEASRDAAQLRNDMASLLSSEKTNACGSTPAFELLRRQLCSSVGGPDCNVQTNPVSP